ncbi:alpha-1,6-mannosyltransferase subunit [Coprinopsis cinerea AmutBmut pab1-1]|nr:alpha-1,6-mannosyltransferase subunit [Coprinopsis cinerea AmutBmut pab1-1]
MSLMLDALLLLTGWTHVLLAPYTKVEESFNLHGIHDVLMYGVSTKALPKPSMTISSSLAQYLEPLLGTKFDLQIMARLVLATTNALGLCLIRRAVSQRFGRLTGLFFAVLTCTQFHLPFWMGRTVPNMFALFLVNLSTYLLLKRAPNALRLSSATSSTIISLLTFTAVVFRAEVALFLAPVALQLLLTKNIGFRKLITVGLTASLLSIATTVLVDSYFWNQPLLWPEFSAIYFNVFQGKSAEWGVSPPLTYFTAFLPKLLLSALPLSIIGMVTDLRIFRLLLPSWIFVTLISFLGHKEWRFIVYVVPIFNVAAARTCKSLVSFPKNGRMGRILFAIPFACILANLAFTSFTTYASIINYPGGEAMRQFHALYPPHSKPVHVHICNLAAQTGASLFHHLNSPPSWPTLEPNVQSAWIYNKTEGLEIDDLLGNSRFTHLIIETPPTDRLLRRRPWKVVDSIRAFDGVKLDLSATKGLLQARDATGLIQRLSHAITSTIQIKRTDKLWILERQS